MKISLKEYHEKRYVEMKINKNEFNIMNHWIISDNLTTICYFYRHISSSWNSSAPSKGCAPM